MRPLFDRIPGALYGNDPGWKADDPGFGNVSVDESAVVQALAFLKRRAVIIDTAAGPYGGVRIRYRLKQKGR